MRIRIGAELGAFVVAALLTFASASWADEALRFQLQRGDESIPIRTLQQALGLAHGDQLLAVADQTPLFALDLSAARASSSGNAVVSGRTREGNRFTLVVGDGDVVEGFIQEGSVRHRLTGTIEQVQLIRRSDSQVRLPAESRPALPVPPKKVSIPPDVSRELKAQSRGLSTPTPALRSEGVLYPRHQLGQAVIDVLIYHDDDMAVDPSVIADLMVEISNQAMIDSDIEIELRLVGLSAMAISNQTTQSDLLTSMFYRDSPFTEIEDDRAALEADLVIAIRDQIPEDDSSCGIAYIGVDQGFPWRRLYVSSVHWNPLEPGTSGNFCDDTTFAHEVGHILGSMHERRLFEEGDTGAYEFSFGHYRDGWLKTIMSYGTEDEKYFFSNPEVSCGDFYGNNIPCGVPAGDPQSADNATGFTNTRHMVAGYYSDQLTHELIVHHRHEGGCQLGAGRSGVFRGHSVMNETQYDLEIRAFAVKTAQGEIVSDTYSAGAEVLRVGEEREFGFDQCVAEDEIHPYGNAYLESWVTYADPISGDLYESIHIPWDEDYQGDYARITIASASGGAVDGHTGVFVKEGVSEQFRFVANSGYRLSGIEGSCKGELAGNVYTVGEVLHDCTIEAYFEVGEGTGGGDGGGEIVDPEPPETAPEGSEGMFTSLLRTVLEQTSQTADSSDSDRSAAPPRPSEATAGSREAVQPIPAATYFSLLMTALMICLGAWLRLRSIRAPQDSRPTGKVLKR